MLFKLTQLGVTPDFIQWFDSYLSDRQQRVVINGVASNLLCLESGVPQGSILGPLLFLIHANDITSDIVTDINLFADDTSLLDVVDNPESSSERLNHDLFKLNTWASQWLVNFNPSKTVVMTFSTRRKPFTYPPLYLDNTQLQLTNVHSHLGMTLSTNLSWSRHINLAVLRASKRVNILKRLKFSMGRNSLIHIYQTMIRPILEYGCIIYDNCTCGEAELLESVQLDAARVCTGALWNTSKYKLLEELGWATLSTRRKFFKLCTLFKMHHDLLPEYLSRGRLIIAGDVSRYPLRNSKNWRVPFARTNKYKLSFYRSAISAYNDLSKECLNIDNLHKLKKHFLPPYFPPVCHFILTLVTDLLPYIIPNYALAIVTFVHIHLNMGWLNPMHVPVVNVRLLNIFSFIVPTMPLLDRPSWRQSLV